MKEQNNEGALPTDRLMTPAEQTAMKIDIQVKEVMKAIAEARKAGLDTGELTGELEYFEHMKNVTSWLNSFTDPREREEAIRLLRCGDLPPELFKRSDNFVVEGPAMPQ